MPPPSAFRRVADMGLARPPQRPMPRHRLPDPSIDEARYAFVLTVHVEATCRVLIRDPWFATPHHAPPQPYPIGQTQTLSPPG